MVTGIFSDGGLDKIQTEYSELAKIMSKKSSKKTIRVQDKKVKERRNAFAARMKCR
jgi:hypothetical protein